MKPKWRLNVIYCLKFFLAAAFLVLTCFGCEKEIRDPIIVENNVLASEDHLVNPEGTSLIALDGSVYIEFSPGAVTSPTLITIASITLMDNPSEEINSMQYGISITNASKDLTFYKTVSIRLNYVMDKFQRSAEVNEEFLTIYKKEGVDSLNESLVCIGECCVDCACNTVTGCISEGGLYVVGERYVVFEVR